VTVHFVFFPDTRPGRDLAVHSGRTRGGLILSSDQAVASANVIDGLAAWVSVSRSLKVKGAGLRAGSKDGPLQVTLHASQARSALSLYVAKRLTHDSLRVL